LDKVGVLELIAAAERPMFNWILAAIFTRFAPTLVQQ
jgi:hypothetical protein